MVKRNHNSPCPDRRWPLARHGLLLALALASGCEEAGADKPGLAQPRTGGISPAPLTTSPREVPAIDRSLSAKKSVINSGTGACHMQGTRRLRDVSRLALGTEPFWSATIEGRCVLYATPETQPGIRLWTRYRRTAHSETWTGAFEGKRFELVLRPHHHCTDGMSDRSYPFAADLALGKARRSGCAMDLANDLPRP